MEEFQDACFSVLEGDNRHGVGAFKLIIIHAAVPGRVLYLTHERVLPFVERFGFSFERLPRPSGFSQCSWRYDPATWHAYGGVPWADVGDRRGCGPVEKGQGGRGHLLF